MKRDLFDMVKDITAGMFISDMRFDNKQKAKKLMAIVDVELFPLQELKDMANYLYGDIVEFENYNDARSFFRAFKYI